LFGNAQASHDNLLGESTRRIEANLELIRQKKSKFTKGRTCPSKFMDLSNTSVTFGSWVRRKNQRQIILLSPYDCEKEILLIKLEVMGPFVEYFIIGEASTSNSNIPRALCFEEVRPNILGSKYASKVLYHVIDGNVENFQYWEQEVFVKNQLAKPLIDNAKISTQIRDDAFVVMLDMDEMISSEHMHFLSAYDHPNFLLHAFKVSLRWSYYGFEWVNPQATTINAIVTWKYFKDECGMMANSIRYNLCNSLPQCVALLPMVGWHCSWCFGNTSQFIQKIEKSSKLEDNQGRYKDVFFLEDQRKRGLWFVDSQPNGCFSDKVVEPYSRP
jgi:Glycosyltransferase family 17